MKNKIKLFQESKNFSNRRISISEIRKRKKKKGFYLKKYNIIKTESFYILSRTLLSCMIIISIFFVLPKIFTFSEKNLVYVKNFDNTAKYDLEKLIRDKNSKLDSQLDNQFLFDDVLTTDEPITNTIRLSAITINELFKSTNYNLEDVRKSKLVKPVSLSLLPKEIKNITNTKKRKDFFIQIILPLIIQENDQIKLDRKKLFNFLNKSKNTKKEKNWLVKKFKQYGVLNNDLSTLKIRMDIIPVSMTIAQAAKETGWGTSRFAQEGNALFGQWTWSGEGIKPAGADDNSTHKVMKFKVLQASVKAYKRNLNTHPSYKEFRGARAELRDEGKKLDSLYLTEFLDKYAETGKEYVKTLKQIISQNKLNDFDDAKLLPSSIDLESLI